jgi:hypothetical protein
MAVVRGSLVSRLIFGAAELERDCGLELSEAGSGVVDVVADDEGTVVGRDFEATGVDGVAELDEGAASKIRFCLISPYSFHSSTCSISYIWIRLGSSQKHLRDLPLLPCPSAPAQAACVWQLFDPIACELSHP